jgi:flavodoxin
MEKPIIFLFSYHHKNTKKIADAIAAKINASISEINDTIKPVEINNYDLFGFGSGIDSGKHYLQMLKFAENLPVVQNKNAFIFSTCGVFTEKKMLKDHKTLRGILLDKGFTIVNEFGCKGHNTNSVLKYFGGMNKESPTAEDIKNAEIFAEKLLH